MDDFLIFFCFLESNQRFLPNPVFFCSRAINGILWPSLKGLLTPGTRGPGGARQQLGSPQPGRRVTGAQGLLNSPPTQTDRTSISSRPSPGQSRRTQACRVPVRSLSPPRPFLPRTWEQGAPTGSPRCCPATNHSWCPRF